MKHSPLDAERTALQSSIRGGANLPHVTFISLLWKLATITRFVVKIDHHLAALSEKAEISKAIGIKITYDGDLAFPRAVTNFGIDLPDETVLAIFLSWELVIS